MSYNTVEPNQPLHSYYIFILNSIHNISTLINFFLFPGDEHAVADCCCRLAGEPPDIHFQVRSRPQASEMYKDRKKC